MAKPEKQPAASAPRGVDVSRAASITVVCGSSGSGKSAWLKQAIAKDSRIIAWDPDDEYSGLSGFVRITSRAELARRLMAAKTGRFSFVPSSVNDFEFWCMAAFGWGECTAVAEETADVTSPAKAPAGWGTLVRRGRKRGITIYAVTQRPSESDKTVIGNATRLHVCGLARTADREYMARELDIDRAKLDALKPLEWVEMHRGSRQLTSGKLKF